MKKSVKVGVAGVLTRNGTVLLLKRKKSPDQGLWALPGGSVEFGETMEAAVLRELHEEAGINARITHHPGTLNHFVSAPQNMHWVVPIFILESTSDCQPQLMEPEKHAQLAWFKLRELPEDLADVSRRAIELAVLHTPHLQFPEGSIGPALINWQSPGFPRMRTLRGQYCLIKPLDPHGDAAKLFQAYLKGGEKIWTYLDRNPLSDLKEFSEYLLGKQHIRDRCYFTIRNLKDYPLGIASYMRIEPEHGCLEIGDISFSPALQRTACATEAIYLLLKQAFELGYQRIEWKCDSRNLASRNAAERFGFTFEGLFRKHKMYKSRYRDTAWYALLSDEWARISKKYELWLRPENFCEDGNQKVRLNKINILGRSENQFKKVG